MPTPGAIDFYSSAWTEALVRARLGEPVLVFPSREGGIGAIQVTRFPSDAEDVATVLRENPQNLANRKLLSVARCAVDTILRAHRHGIAVNDVESSNFATSINDAALLEGNLEVRATFFDWGNALINPFDEGWEAPVNRGLRARLAAARASLGRGGSVKRQKVDIDSWKDEADQSGVFRHRFDEALAALQQASDGFFGKALLMTKDGDVNALAGVLSVVKPDDVVTPWIAALEKAALIHSLTLGFITYEREIRERFIVLGIREYLPKKPGTDKLDESVVAGSMTVAEVSGIRRMLGDLLFPVRPSGIMIPCMNLAGLVGDNATLDILTKNVQERREFASETDARTFLQLFCNLDTLVMDDYRRQCVSDWTACVEMIYGFMQGRNADSALFEELDESWITTQENYASGRSVAHIDAMSETRLLSAMSKIC